MYFCNSSLNMNRNTNFVSSSRIHRLGTFEETTNTLIILECWVKCERKQIRIESQKPGCRLLRKPCMRYVKVFLFNRFYLRAWSLISSFWMENFGCSGKYFSLIYKKMSLFSLSGFWLNFSANISIWTALSRILFMMFCTKGVIL